MTKITVRLITEIPIFRAAIDEVRLQFNGDGIATRIVRPGKHYLSWFALGNQGQTYHIEISDPPNTGCFGNSAPQGLDETGVEFGACTFDIAQEED